MKSELLLASARELTNEEAGGHGNRWGVFAQDVEDFLGQWLGVAAEQSEAAIFGIGQKSDFDTAQAMGESNVFGLLYTGQELGTARSGLVSLIHLDPGGDGREPSNQLWSAFPFLGDGVAQDAEVEEIGLFPNRIEARLTLNLPIGAQIMAFDTSFWQNRAVYRPDEQYRFVLSALAYRMEPAPDLKHVIEDEHQIRRYRAREAWLHTHGCWTPEDEEAALQAWVPQTAQDLEPITITMSDLAAMMPSSTGPADDAMYRGQVISVVPRAVRMLDVDFWRVDTLVTRADEDLVLPIYVAESLFGGEWRPQVGQYVTGSLWLQAYATHRAGAGRATH